MSDFKLIFNIVGKKFIIESQIGLQNREIDFVRKKWSILFNVWKSEKRKQMCTVKIVVISAVIISITILFNFDL